jgi:hypothetical protein
MDNRKLRLTNRVCGSREILHLWRFRCVDCCFGWRCLNFKATTLACHTRRNCSSSSSSELDHSLCYVCVCLSPTKRTARALRPSRQESQTAQRRPHGPDIDSSPQSCNAQSLYPLVHFISLSLSDLFWLHVHAPCLLYYSSLQSYTVRAATLRVFARWSTSSLSLSQTFSGSLRMLRVCSTTVLFRAALSELQHSESATSLQNP